MSPTKRTGLSGWISRAKGWHLILGFIALAGTLGTATIAGFTGFERKWGILAANFGFARQASVTRDLRELRHEMRVDNAKTLGVAERTQLWILYDQIKRTQRNIDFLKDKRFLSQIEREQLQDFANQLAEATKDYQVLAAKVKKEAQLP